MTRFAHSPLRGGAAALAIAAALALSGCNPPQAADDSQSVYSAPALPATLPLVPGDATEPLYAPAVADLPDARPIGAVRVPDPDEYYAYADEAAGFAEALGDAPPDYGFDYEDGEPWGWQGYDDSLAFAEPIEDGYRYYYYRPGEDDPYFVRDPYYSYGYDDGRLAVIYDSYGAIVPYHLYNSRLQYASRYYVRGSDLYRASRYRHPVIAGNWAARHRSIADARMDWRRTRERQQAWQAYHDRRAAQQAQYWRQERARREADTIRFTAWRGQDFRTPPPPRAIPAAWTRARWARDERRFAPPARGFDGNQADRQRAAAREHARIAAQPRQPEAARQDQVRIAAAQRSATRIAQQEARQMERARSARRQAEAPGTSARAEALIRREQRQAEQASAQTARRQEQSARRQEQTARGQAQAARQADAGRQAARQQQQAVRQQQQAAQAQRQQEAAARQQAARQRDAAREQQARERGARVQDARERQQQQQAAQAQRQQQAAERQAARQREVQERARQQQSQQASAQAEARRQAQAQERAERQQAQAAATQAQAGSQRAAEAQAARVQAQAAREQARAARAAEAKQKAEDRKADRERPPR